MSAAIIIIMIMIMIMFVLLKKRVRYMSILLRIYEYVVEKLQNHLEVPVTLRKSLAKMSFPECQLHCVPYIRS